MGAICYSARRLRKKRNHRGDPDRKAPIPMQVEDDSPGSLLRGGGISIWWAARRCRSKVFAGATIVRYRRNIEWTSSTSTAELFDE